MLDLREVAAAVEPLGGGEVEPLTQLLLFGTASTAILTVIAIYEGWYGDHLARLAGAEPSRAEVPLE